MSKCSSGHGASVCVVHAVLSLFPYPWMPVPLYRIRSTFLPGNFRCWHSTRNEVEPPSPDKLIRLDRAVDWQGCGKGVARVGKGQCVYAAWELDDWLIKRG